MVIREVPGSSGDDRPRDRSMQAALDELIRALTLAPTIDPKATALGSSLLLTMLIDGPAILTRPELGLLIALVQRISLRHGWIIPNDSNREKL